MLELPHAAVSGARRSQAEAGRDLAHPRPAAESSSPWLRLFLPPAVIATAALLLLVPSVRELSGAQGSGRVSDGGRGGQRSCAHAAEPAAARGRERRPPSGHPVVLGQARLRPGSPLRRGRGVSPPRRAVGYFVDRKAATLVYGRRLHSISLFVFKADGLPWPSAGLEVAGRAEVYRRTSARGFNVLLWRDGEARLRPRVRCERGRPACCSPRSSPRPPESCLPRGGDGAERSGVTRGPCMAPALHRPRPRARVDGPNTTERRDDQEAECRGLSTLLEEAGSQDGETEESGNLQDPRGGREAASGRSSTSSVTEPVQRIRALRRERLRAIQNFRYRRLGASRGVHDHPLLRRQLRSRLPGAKEALEEVLARVGHAARPAPQPLPEDALRGPGIPRRGRPRRTGSRAPGRGVDSRARRTSCRGSPSVRSRVTWAPRRRQLIPYTLGKRRRVDRGGALLFPRYPREKLSRGVRADQRRARGPR